MPSESDFIQYDCDQIDGAREMSNRHMFGGTTLYLKGQVVALICDNQLFIKPTEAGRAYIVKMTEAPADGGSKNFFVA